MGAFVEGEIYTPVSLKAGYKEVAAGRAPSRVEMSVWDMGCVMGVTAKVPKHRAPRQGSHEAAQKGHSSTSTARIVKLAISIIIIICT